MGHEMGVVGDSDHSTYARALRDERSDHRILADACIPSLQVCAFRHVLNARVLERWDFLEESMQ